jgi:hypothetical protein
MHPFRFAIPIAAVAVLVAVGPAAEAATAYRAHWTFDEVGSPVARDVSGHGNDGTNYNIVGTGIGYKFNGTNSRVVVPSAANLNPGSANFSWGVTFSMTKPPAAGDTYDVLRKGLVTTSGGDYKLEVEK